MRVFAQVGGVATAGSTGNVIARPTQPPFSLSPKTSPPGTAEIVTSPALSKMNSLLMRDSSGAVLLDREYRVCPVGFACLVADVVWARAGGRSAFVSSRVPSTAPLTFTPSPSRFQYFSPIVNFLRTGVLVVDPSVSPEGQWELMLLALAGVVPNDSACSDQLSLAHFGCL